MGGWERFFVAIATSRYSLRTKDSFGLKKKLHEDRI